MNNKLYVTTPIYYVNDAPHIGHAYTTIIADTVASYARLKGMDAFFLTGTDEHGQKNEESAKSRNKSAKEWADENSQKFKTLWDEFGIKYDGFIRTTDESHKKGVLAAFMKMWEKGDIYKGEFEGNYCVSCETFFAPSQLVDNEFCPDCGKPTSILKEENYFFRLSKYESDILKWYHDNEDCILPKSKKNEVMRFVEGGLKDLSITRTSFEWGIKLPPELNDDKHVIYVWLDALLNYVTALGYGQDNSKMGYWPSDIQIVGKDILKFHAVYWPAFLLSLDLELPKHIAAHGWWTRDGEKMSKSKGNVVNPKEIADTYGLEVQTEVQPDPTGNRIGRRIIHLVEHRGTANTTKRFEYGKDLTQIKRDIDSGDVITRLYGWGKGIEQTNDQGEATGGYSRKISFADVNNGKPYVQDDQALANWGIVGADGTKHHSEASVDFPDCEDPKELLNLTKAALKTRTTPTVSYTADVTALGQAGYDPEGTDVGDSVQIIDTSFTTPLRLEGRILQIEEDLAGSLADTKITLGNIRQSYTQRLAAQQQALDKLVSNSGAWNSAAGGTGPYMKDLIDRINQTNNLRSQETIASTIAVLDRKSVV